VASRQSCLRAVLVASLVVTKDLPAEATPRWARAYDNEGVSQTVRSRLAMRRTQSVQQVPTDRNGLGGGWMRWRFSLLSSDPRTASGRGCRSQRPPSVFFDWPLSCLSARFSFRDFAGFLAFGFFGDLSPMRPPSWLAQQRGIRWALVQHVVANATWFCALDDGSGWAYGRCGVPRGQRKVVSQGAAGRSFLGASCFRWPGP